jgi:hypothetical protein
MKDQVETKVVPPSDISGRSQGSAQTSANYAQAAAIVAQQQQQTGQAGDKK